MTALKFLQLASMTENRNGLIALRSVGLRWGFVAMLAAACGAAAAESTGAGADYDCEAYSSVDVFDGEASPEARIAAIGVVQRAALVPKCARERYVLGLLHRYGPDLPGNPLPKDPVQARQWLETYALEGNVEAFAELAEFALAESDGRAAMQWTQVYLSLLHQQEALIDDFDRRGYNADLLKRATRALRKDRSLPRSSATELLNDYLATRNAQLVARAAEARARLLIEDSSSLPDGEGAVKVRRRPGENATSRQRMEPGYAVFLLEVQPDGTVSRIVAESFAPSIDNALKLRPMVEGFEFYPLSGNVPEIVRVPVVYGYASHGAATLKK